MQIRAYIQPNSQLKLKITVTSVDLCSILQRRSPAIFCDNLSKCKTAVASHYENLPMQ